MKEEQNYKKGPGLHLQALNACLGAWLFGIYFSQYNALQVTFHKMYEWDDNEKLLYDGLITASFPIGCTIGCLFAAWSIKFGRRKAMIIADLISLIGIGVSLVGPNSFPVATICLGRAIVGAMAGINCTAINLYINEIAPKQLASILGGLFQLFVNAGIITGLILAFGKPNKEDVKGEEDNSYWRLVFASPFVPAILRLILLMVVYKSETPKFYYEQGNKEQAKQELAKVYNTEEDVAKQMEILEESTQATTEPTYAELFSKKYFKSTICAICLQIGQQLTGINAIVFYSTDMFAPFGDNSSQKDLQVAAYFSLLVSICLALPQFVVGQVINKFGRKQILVVGQIIMIVNLVILCLMDFVVENKFIKLMFLLLYCFAFGVSAGPIVWFYIPEFCGPKAVGLGTIANWISCVIVGFSFQYIKEALTLGGAFMLYACISFGFLIFQIIFCIETKGKTPKQIVEAFQGKSGLVPSNESEEKEKLNE